MYPASAPAYIMGKTLHGISGVFIGLGPIQVLLIINVCQSCLCLRAFSELVDRASVREFQGKTVAHWLLLRINFPNSTRAPKSNNSRPHFDYGTKQTSFQTPKDSRGFHVLDCFVVKFTILGKKIGYLSLFFETASE